MKWKFAQNAGSSLGSWIVSKPWVALSILLILILLATGISAKIVRDRTLLEAEKIIRMEKAALEAREEENQLKYKRDIQPILRERNQLRKRLADLRGEREAVKPPESENELVSRFRALGY